MQVFLGGGYREARWAMGYGNGESEECDAGRKSEGGKRSSLGGDVALPCPVGAAVRVRVRMRVRVGGLSRVRP